jgi:hypothetical protein
MLERSSKGNEITDWLAWFVQKVLHAREATLSRVEFHIAKAQFHIRLRSKPNKHQEKTIARSPAKGSTVSRAA